MTSCVSGTDHKVSRQSSTNSSRISFESSFEVFARPIAALRSSRLRSIFAKPRKVAAVWREWKNDKKHGLGKYILASGEVAHDGEWENGNPKK